ncbi:MAG TPA: hypothetical protein VGS79_14995, partial [Puia sp.]|nr:hypothetical protein [Puia sp.]
MSKKRFLPSVFRRPIGLLFLVLCTAFSTASALSSPVASALADQQTVPLQTFMVRMQHEYGIYFSYQADSL